MTQRISLLLTRRTTNYRWIICCVLFSTTSFADDRKHSEAVHRIDQIIESHLAANGRMANPAAPDAVFLRRVYLDVVGRIPTVREARDFLESEDANRRSKLIDTLLVSDGFHQHWFHYWADLLRLLSNGTYNGNAGRVTGKFYEQFIRESTKSNKPYDVFVRELVTARGTAWDNGAIGYYQRDRGMPLENMAITARIFLGTRIECAQCHDHPFDSWTQKQFYEFSAFTYGVQTTFGTYSQTYRDVLALRRAYRERSGTNFSEEVFFRLACNEMVAPMRHADVTYRDLPLKLPTDYRYSDAKPGSVVKPAVLMGEPIPHPLSTNRLDTFGNWLTSAKNPRFTKAIANRMWKKVIGVGLVEPVDGWSDQTKPTIPELMDALELLMTDVRYDLKAFVRVLLNTKTYQRMVTTEEINFDEPYDFRGPVFRRMTAEQIWDSFMTLVHDKPDWPSLGALEAEDKFLSKARLFAASLEALTPQEMLDRAEKTSEIFRTNAQEIKVQQAKMAEARASNDEVKVKELGRALGQLRQSEKQFANKHIFLPAVLKLASQGPKRHSSEAIEENVLFDTISVPGHEPKDWTDARADQEHALAIEADTFQIPERLHESYLNYRRTALKNWTRAIYLDSPAPPGHPLREFGQSDRQSVENANDSASVAQSLVLMNSQIIAEILRPWSQLKLALKSARTIDEQLTTICLAIYTRYPTEEEKILWKEWELGPNSKVDDFIFAMLNTPQFLFIE